MDTIHNLLFTFNPHWYGHQHEGNRCAPSQWAERACGFDPTSCRCCCRASGDDRVIFLWDQRAFTGTGTNAITSPTSAVSQAPTTGTGTGAGEAPAGLTAMPNAPAKDPETPSAAAESPVTTIATSSETMLLGKSHEWQDNGEGAFFSEPPKKKGRGQCT